MGKLEENKNTKKAQFDDDLNEEEYSQWIQKQFLKEAEEIEAELGDIPDTEDWEPTEAKFQALLKRAREQELLENTDTSMASNNDGLQTTKEETTEIRNETKNAKNTKDTVQEQQKPEKITRTILKKKVVKWTAAAAAVFIGIFGFSMTSEASRAYIMEEVNKMFGNDVNTEVDNDDVFHSDRTEKYAYDDIGDTLNLTMPKFFYMPNGMNYQGYTLDEDAQTAYLQYLFGEEIVYLMILSNVQTASGLSQNDIGEELEIITSDLTKDLNIALWEIQEEGDKKPMYSLRWKYKNSYYELFGKLSKAEMENIAENIIY